MLHYYNIKKIPKIPCVELPNRQEKNTKCPYIKRGEKRARAYKFQGGARANTTFVVNLPKLRVSKWL